MFDVEPRCSEVSDGGSGGLMIFKKRLQWRLVEAWQCSLQGDAGVYPSAA
jgi:hypothetical protein